METFVRKDFYIDPPDANATPEQWNEWLNADRQEAIKAKRAYTRTLEAGDMPESMQASAMRKVNGVWKASTAIGFVGDAEAGTGHVEPTVEATQEVEVLQAEYINKPRGLSHLKSGNAKRKARRAARKLRKLGIR